MKAEELQQQRRLKNSDIKEVEQLKQKIKLNSYNRKEGWTATTDNKVEQLQQKIKLNSYTRK